MRFRHLALPFLAVAATCHAVPDRAPAPLSCTLVHLRTGPKPPPKEAADSMFQGHFANMQRLANLGHLLVAGPYGRQKSAPDLRGILILDTADRAIAAQWAESDPACQAGVFVPEYYDLQTGARLREFLAAELAAQAALRASGKTPAPGEGGRGYVLLTAADGRAAIRCLDGLAGVLLLGVLEVTQAFAVLDAQDLVAAERLLQPVRPRLGEHRLDEWFASGRLVDLPKLGSR
jgi:uncharacterized protein YciI